MSHEQPAPGEKLAEPQSDELSPRELITSIISDARALASAEIGYYRARFDYSRHAIKWAIIFGALAVFLLGTALIALILGLLLILTEQMGPIWATLIVTGSLLLISVTLGFCAKSWLTRMRFPEIADDDGAT